MAYVKCKVHNEGQEPYQVEALIDTSSLYNFISKSLLDKLGIIYCKSYERRIPKKALGFVDCLNLSFQYEEEDKFLSRIDRVYNDFIVKKNPKAELVLGIPWLFLRESKIDIFNYKISIYDKFIPLCKKSAK